MRTRKRGHKRGKGVISLFCGSPPETSKKAYDPFFGATTNTGKIFQNGIRAIPDAYEWGKALWEVKDVQSLYQSAQLMAEMAEAEAEGIQFNLVVSEGAEISGPLLQTIRAIGGAIYELGSDGTITEVLQGTALGY